MDMEDWWTRNSSNLQELGMDFDDHACITTLPGHQRQAECKTKLADLITKNRRWEATESGSYFGSPVQKSTYIPSATPRKEGLARRVFKVKGRGSVDEEGISRSSSNDSGTPSTASSQTESSYHTPTDSMPPSPSTVGPSTPRSLSTIKVPRNIDTNLPGSNHRHQPSSEETPTTKSSPDSMFHARYAILTHLKFLTYAMHEVSIVATLRTPQ